jgi:hypothetical protein
MAEKTIKIIDVKKKIIDISNIPIDELIVALDIFLENKELKLNKNAIYSFTNMAANLQSQKFLLFKQLENIISIDIRNLLNNKSIIPINDL